MLPGDHLGGGQGLAIHRFEQVLLPDEAQFFPVRVVGEGLHHIRAGVDELSMKLGDEVWMLQHDLRSVRPGLEVAASLELEKIPLGTDDWTRSSRSRSPSPGAAAVSFTYDLLHFPWRRTVRRRYKKSSTEYRFVAEDRLVRRVGERRTVRAKRRDRILGPPVEG